MFSEPNKQALIVAFISTPSLKCSGKMIHSSNWLSALLGRTHFTQLVKFSLVKCWSIKAFWPIKGSETC